MKYLIGLIIVMAFLSFPKAQPQTVYSRNNNIWLHYSGKNMLTKKLSFTFEGTFRFANGFSENSSILCVRRSITN